MMVAMALVFPVAPIAFYSILQTFQQHFTTNNGSSPSKGSHGELSTITLQESTLLVLHIGRRWDYTGQAGPATHACRGAYWGHRHAGRTAQRHWALTHHRLRLIPPLIIRTVGLLILRILRLPILRRLRLLILRL